jgi:hypothetical protein
MKITAKVDRRGERRRKRRRLTIGYGVVVVVVGERCCNGCG